MKLAMSLKMIQIRLFITTLGCWIFIVQASAQLCDDPGNIIFALRGDGNIHPVNINTGILGAQLNPVYPGNAPSAPNGIGYSLLNGKFYYFKRSPSSVTQEFVSFDPATNAITVLSSCPTTNSVYIGCVASNGIAYYCWDSQSRLFYYNIPANTWTLITTALVDQFGKDVDSIFRAHGSGDAAIDGYGNLLMLPSSNSRYGLFSLSSPLPTSAVASIAVRQILPMVNPPAKFVGIALNATGQIILNTATPSNNIYRLENNLSLTLLSTTSVSLDDLTSCNFSFSVLPVSFNNFTASLKNNTVALNWETTGPQGYSNYYVQHSSDAVHWEEIGSLNPAVQPEQGKKLSFTHLNPSKGKNFYRIVREGENQKKIYSEIETVVMSETASMMVWPNPAQEFLVIESPIPFEQSASAAIYDISGRKVKQVKLIAGTSKIDIRSLDKGNYVVSVQTRNGENRSYKIVKR